MVIAGFHCHTIIDQRIKEIKEDKYTNSLAKIQVCEIFRVGDIRGNVLLKFIKLCKANKNICH